MHAENIRKRPNEGQTRQSGAPTQTPNIEEQSGTMRTVGGAGPPVGAAGMAAGRSDSEGDIS